MKTILKTICDSAFVTAGSNNLNIIGIFEHINSSNFPATHPKIVLILSLSDCKPNQEIRYYPIIEGPEGIILDGSQKVSLAKVGSTGKINIIYNITNLALPKPGKYTARLIAGDLEEKIEFDVRITPTIN